MRIHQILEARRNPELNKKVSALSELEKYRGRKDVFVSFTDDVGKMSHRTTRSRSIDDPATTNASGAKIGINPLSDHLGTPIGIYGYPVDHVLDVKLSVEYGRFRPFIWVFRVRNVEKALYFSEYGQDNLIADFEKLKKLFPKNKNTLKKYLIDKTNALSSMANERKYGQIFWDLIRSIHQMEEKFSIVRWSMLLRKIGYESVIDDAGYKIIYSNEPKQGVFLGKDTIETLELIRNISPKSPMNFTEIMVTFPEKFSKAIHDKTISDEQIIEVLKLRKQKGMNTFGYYNNLSKNVQKYMKNNVKEFILKGNLLKDFGFSNKEITQVRDRELITLLDEKELRIIMSSGDESLNEFIVSIMPIMITRIKNPSEKMQLDVLSKSPNAIFWIKNPTQKVQLKAISDRIDKYNVKEIISHLSANGFMTLEVMHYVIDHIPYSIAQIKNPPEEIKIKSIQEYPDSILYIDRPSEKLQLLAVSLKPDAIFSIKNKNIPLSVMKKALSYYEKSEGMTLDDLKKYMKK